jgi:cytochrome c peroxidase
VGEPAAPAASLQRVRVKALRALAGLFALGLLGAGAAEVKLPIPDGVLPPEIPQDNPLTPAKVELGKKLYFDARLSAKKNQACASCHSPATGFADPRHTKTSAGSDGRFGPRNAPTTLDAAFFSAQFWDGRAATLEDQAVLPFINPIEMGIPDHPALERLVASLSDYPPLFSEAFGSPQVTVDRIGKALASFERTLLSLSAPIDRFLAGDPSAIPEAAKRGWALFNGKARCNSCHGHVDAFPIFSDDLYHNIGVQTKDVDFENLARRAREAATSQEAFEKLAFEPDASALGRFIVTRQPKDIGAFKTPLLRNVALTAPYMHDGSQATLREVIDFYDRGGEPNANLDGGIRPLGLSEQEKADLVALLESLTSDDLDRFRDLVGLMPK